MFWLVLALTLCLPVERVLFPDTHQQRPALVYLTRGLVTALLTLLATAMLVGKSYNPFLYYRF